MKKTPAYLRGQLYEAEVDDEDYKFLSQYKWTAKVSKRTRTVYAQTNFLAPGRYVNISMHRMIIGDAVDAIEDDNVPYQEVPVGNGKIVFIIQAGYERFRKKSVDHVDGNGLNNCRLNLRHATCSEQVKNRRL